MKKFTKIIALALVFVTLVCVLASCGKKLSGEYYVGDKTITKSYTTYTFKGSKVTVEAYAFGNKVANDSFEAKYSIKDGEITFTWEDADGNEKTNTQTFEELEDGSIKIGLIKYTKAD